MTGSPRLTFAFHRAAWTILAALAFAVASLAAPDLTRAQGVEGATESYYAYVSPDASTMMMLAHLEPDDPDLAGDMVSPAIADDFFEGFTLFTDYDFAHDVGPDRIAQVEDADEYMVFDGMLDFTDGIKPGHVIFLSASEQVFVVAGYDKDVEVMFGLAEQVIEEGMPPFEFEDFTRIDLTEEVESAEGELDRIPSDGLKTAEESGEIVCFDDPAIGALDADGDGVVTIAELQELADVPEIATVLEQLEAAGVGGIQYSDC
jgi:hypothetical protein